MYFINQAQNVDFSKNPYADGKFRFTDQTLMDEIGIGNKVTLVIKSGVLFFFLVLITVS